MLSPVSLDRLIVDSNALEAAGADATPADSGRGDGASGRIVVRSFPIPERGPISVVAGVGALRQAQRMGAQTVEVIAPDSASPAALLRIAVAAADKRRLDPLGLGRQLRAALPELWKGDSAQAVSTMAKLLGLRTSFVRHALALAEAVELAEAAETGPTRTTLCALPPAALQHVLTDLRAGTKPRDATTVPPTTAATPSPGEVIIPEPDVEAEEAAAVAASAPFRRMSKAEIKAMGGADFRAYIKGFLRPHEGAKDLHDHCGGKLSRSVIEKLLRGERPGNPSTRARILDALEALIANRRHAPQPTHRGARRSQESRPTAAPTAILSQTHEAANTGTQQPATPEKPPVSKQLIGGLVASGHGEDTGAQSKLFNARWTASNTDDPSVASGIEMNTGKG